MTVKSKIAAAKIPFDDDIDIRALGHGLWRRKKWIIWPTVIVAIAATIGVNLVTPRYKSEARVLYEGRENIFLRPEAEKSNIDRTAADQEALTSQVQLVLSRELAFDVIKKLKLNENPEFDPVLKGISPLKYLLVLAGIARDPMEMSSDERVLESYNDRLSAYFIEKSRVIVAEFQSADPELAARVANAVVETYLGLQQSAKQVQTRGAGQWLSGEIEQLRAKVAEAESKVSEFRAKSNLLVGTNNTNLANQQLGEFNSQLAAARAQRSDAETRARMIRDMLRRGEPIEASEVVNSELIRRLAEQRVALRGQLAEQSSTLLDGHPRIKELKAQIADYDQQIRAEAEKLIRSLESDAKISGARVESFGSNLDVLKNQAASTNEQDVQLRALEREAKAQRDLLESYLSKYREAAARDSIGSAPPDAWIISRAIVSNIPYFPKKLPIVFVASLAALVLSASFIATGELLRSSPEPAIATAVSRRLAAPTHPELGVPLTSIDEFAHRLRTAGRAGRCLTVFGASATVGTTLAAITIARALARDAKVVLLDLAFAAPELAAISSDPQAPGISDVIAEKASFGTVITRDKLSSLHLITAGKAGTDRLVVMASPRLPVMIEALMRNYDHVVVDAGLVAAAGVERFCRLAAFAALITSDPAATETKMAQARLTAAGFGEVAVLGGAVPAGRQQAA